MSTKQTSSATPVDPLVITQIREDAKYVYRALDYIRQQCDIMADDLKGELEVKWIEQLQAMGESGNAAIAKCMSISDQCDKLAKNDTIATGT